MNNIMIVMNRKYNVLIAIAMTLSANALFSAEARNIRKDLQLKHENNFLNECQLSEDGLSLVEVLDRDIRIMEDHKKLLQARIDNSKGTFARSVAPFFNKLGAAIIGSFSVATGAFAVGGADWTDRLWQGEGDWKIKVADAGTKVAFFVGYYGEKDIAQHNSQKLEYLNEKIPGFSELTILTGAAGVVSAVSGLLFIKTVYSIFKYHGRLDTAVAGWKTKIDRDVLIIAQLKQIKYDNGL